MSALLEEIVAALRWILEWLGVVGSIASVGFIAWNLMSDEEKGKLINSITNVTRGALFGAAALLADVETQLAPLVSAFVSAVNSAGGPILTELEAPIKSLTETALRDQEAELRTIGISTPDNALDSAAEAMGTAFGFGMASAGVAAAFEAAFPEKLNVLNGVAPMLAKMAGFDEIAAAVRDPLYKNAFGRSLDYHYRSIFKPELPDEADAVKWNSRGLLTPAQLRTVFDNSGLKTEYETAFIDSAYRPIPSFLVTRAAETQAIDAADLQSVFKFNGFRDADVAILLKAYAALALQPYIAQYITAAVRSTELGVMTPQELGDSLTQANLNQEQQAWIQLTVATRKLEQLAELYRKSISESYRYGTLTDAQYVPALEAIGIGAADAQAHYAVDSIAKQGKAAQAAVRAEARLEAQRTRAAGKAAIQGYRTGTLDAVALEAALLAAGYDPAVAGYAVAYETLKQEGAEVFIYGVTLPRAQALLLREQVGALGVQVKAQLVTPAAALAALAGYGVPTANAQALVAEWAATHTPASDVGVLEPR